MYINTRNRGFDRGRERWILFSSFSSSVAGVHAVML
jgi:hypothetical protein